MACSLCHLAHRQPFRFVPCMFSSGQGPLSPFFRLALAPPTVPLPPSSNALHFQGERTLNVLPVLRITLCLLVALS